MEYSAIVDARTSKLAVFAQNRTHNKLKKAGTFVPRSELYQRAVDFLQRERYIWRLPLKWRRRIAVNKLFWETPGAKGYLVLPPPRAEEHPSNNILPLPALESTSK